MSSVTDKLINTEEHPCYYSTNNDQVRSNFHKFRSKRDSNMADLPPESPTATFEQEFPLVLPSTRNRLVDKKGRLRVKGMRIPEKTKLYIADLFTTAIDLRWKWVGAIFCFSYIFSWFFFGMLWWFMVLTRGEGVCVSQVCCLKNYISNTS